MVRFSKLRSPSSGSRLPGDTLAPTTERSGVKSGAAFHKAREASVADKKVVFVAFAIEDERQRDFLKGQTLTTTCPFEYVDMSVKEAYDSNWKERVRTRI